MRMNQLDSRVPATPVRSVLSLLRTRLVVPGPSRVHPGTAPLYRCRMPAAAVQFQISPQHPHVLRWSNPPPRTGQTARSSRRRSCAISLIGSRLRPSSQSWMLVSHCTNSPRQLRRGRQTCTSLLSPGFAFQPPASISHFRSVSLLTVIPCCCARYSAAKVGPKSPYSRFGTARPLSLASLPAIRRFEARPLDRAPPPVPFLRTRAPSRNPRSLIPSCSAAAPCVRWPCLTSCSTFSRSRSFCLSNNGSCSSATLQTGRLRNRNFLLCSYRNFSRCCDTPGEAHSRE